MEDQMSELRASLPQMVRDLVPNNQLPQQPPAPMPPLQHPTTPSDDAPPHDVTHDAPPAVSASSYKRAECLAGSHQQPNRWKIPFTEHNVISGSGCHPPFVAITESWLKSYMQMHKFPSMTIMPTDHMLVEVVLGCNLLAEDTQPSNIHQETDKFSFRAVNCHETDFNGMNEELSSIDWEELYQLCEMTLKQPLS
ncbi:unnamed protein product [Gadus morhua 'NCC']